MTASSPTYIAACSPPTLRGGADIAHPRPYWAALTVQPNQLSRAVDHASNVDYVAWLDRAAELHADAAGYTRQAMLDMNRMWFVARHEIDYLAEARPGDQLFIATWVRTMHRTKSWRDSLIVRPADERMICRAATLWVWVNLESRRPARIEPAMIDAFDPLDRLAANHQPVG